MNSEERKAKIREIKSQKPFATGTLLKYQGQTQQFDVYKISLDFLVYNVKNGRISSFVKSYKKEHAPLDANKEDDAKKIEGFLFSSSEERNKKTREDIIANGQMEPGIITADGVIVDGNRRASLLREISRTHPDQNVRDRCGYFLTRILPEDADPKEILRLETTYQMSSDSKVDYNPIEKYLHAKDMYEMQFTTKQICEYMGLKSESEVLKTLEVMDLIDEYLETYGYDGIYTRLPRGCEDDLLKLNQTLRQIDSGGNKFGWIPQDRIDEVKTDVKAICFDFIRLEEKGDFDFRALTYTSGGNILQNQATWEKMVDYYNKAQDSFEEEESVDDVLASSKSDTDTKALLDKRDKKWKQMVRESLLDAYKTCKDIVDNKKEANKPLALLTKAKNSLEAVDEASLDSASKKEELTDILVAIKQLAESLGSKLNSK